MDTTIRNLDERIYRQLKARAALERRTIGETVNEAVRLYLAGSPTMHRVGSLSDLKAIPYPEGTDRLSEEVDAVVYGE
jgi:plasmid stability protein